MENNVAMICTLSEIGTFIGGIFTGHISDNSGKRSIYIFPQLVISAFLMAFVKLLLSEEPAPYYFFVFAIGLFLGGPANILSSVIAIDLA